MNVPPALSNRRNLFVITALLFAILIVSVTVPVVLIHQQKNAPTLGGASSQSEDDRDGSSGTGLAVAGGLAVASGAAAIPLAYFGLKKSKEAKEHEQTEKQFQQEASVHADRMTEIKQNDDSGNVKNIGSAVSEVGGAILGVASAGMTGKQTSASNSGTTGTSFMSRIFGRRPGTSSSSAAGASSTSTSVTSASGSGFLSSMSKLFGGRRPNSGAAATPSSGTTIATTDSAPLVKRGQEGGAALLGAAVSIGGSITKAIGTDKEIQRDKQLIGLDRQATKAEEKQDEAREQVQDAKKKSELAYVGAGALGTTAVASSVVIGTKMYQMHREKKRQEELAAMQDSSAKVVRVSNVATFSVASIAILVLTVPW